MKLFFGRLLGWGLTSFLLYKSALAFQKIAWGTGNWRGEYSLKWGVAYFAYVGLCILAAILLGALIFRAERFHLLFEKIIALREKSGWARWFLVLLVFILPVWFFQFTPWGVVFKDLSIRVLFWVVVAVILSFLVTRGNTFFGWVEILLIVLITSGEFVLVVPFMNVTEYPFSLGWSEGNRMWDYSIMFGRHIYDYPADKKIPVLLDAGRQFIGGLPFLIPGLTISMERFWIGLTVILPYLFLGFAAFRSARKDWAIWGLAGLWTLIFLKQGPIHPPLVLCAVVVALLWRSPLWLAIPFIALTGYAAEESRYTWLFAPGMWIGMLELAGAPLNGGKLRRDAWIRAVILGLVGMVGGYFGPKIAGILAGNSNASAAITVGGVSASVSDQPLLWYRLLPNATYGIGILAGLLIATLPLIVLLIYLAVSKRWKLNGWQSLAIFSPLLAFLGVGLVASTKIGGGGDLHNMDMFLIGLFFTGVIAWENGGKEWATNINLSPFWTRVALLLLFALPGLQSLGEMRSYGFAEDASWLVTLTDAPNENALDMYPSQAITDSALETIRREVALARSQGGEILFMDQRQLLTFGYIEGVPLVPEYEKKVLMNEALSSEEKYFQSYYADLAAKRFSLIISDQLRTPVKDSSFQFGEENNAWVKWVSIPTLCYYEPKVTLREVGVQLLVPKADTAGCSSQLPEGLQP
ncbi:MAG: hypothetical protein HXY35_16835 [Chloroflexi bacterium]|nr:hypothetical protein [Chloroflexota bacterium]